MSAASPIEPNDSDFASESRDFVLIIFIIYCLGINLLDWTFWKVSLHKFLFSNLVNFIFWTYAKRLNHVILSRSSFYFLFFPFHCLIVRLIYVLNIVLKLNYSFTFITPYLIFLLTGCGGYETLNIFLEEFFYISR